MKLDGNALTCAIAALWREQDKETKEEWQARAKELRAAVDQTPERAAVEVGPSTSRGGKAVEVDRPGPSKRPRHEERDDPDVVDGPLGPLKIDAPSLTIGDGKLGTPAAVLQLAKWLWSRPAAEELVFDKAKLLPIGGDVLGAAVRLGLLDGMRLKCAYHSVCACLPRSFPACFCV